MRRPMSDLSMKGKPVDVYRQVTPHTTSIDRSASGLSYAALAAHSSYPQQDDDEDGYVRFSFFIYSTNIYLQDSRLLDDENE
jgi:hypothetical protein